VKYDSILKETHDSYQSFVTGLNKFMLKFRSPIALKMHSRRGRIMCTTEQKSNMMMLLSGVIDNKVEGDIVEFGCYKGFSAALFASVAKDRAPERKVYLYDHFKADFDGHGGVRKELEERLKSVDADNCIICDKDMYDLVDEELPEKVSFVHIDVGWGDAPESHARLIRQCLSLVYDKMPDNAVCMLMDYHDELTIEGWDANPGVRIGCEEFLADKQESGRRLFGGDCSQGYFRKGSR